MRIAYVSGPYRSKEGVSGVLRNIALAREVAIELWKMGWAVICPHMNTALMEGDCSDEALLEGDLEMIRRLRPGTDVMVMVGDWRQSEGAIKELYLSQNLDLCAFMWDAKDTRQMLGDLANSTVSTHCILPCYHNP